ncbi:unnamed protein product [Ilex paraguariensis]|uniref:AAA+ ATPase domain-containing protein n=1 Tax=Ilex paraguariensis TaxID=185542 RepID=A0ABC8RIB9_9AQUA
MFAISLVVLFFVISGICLFLLILRLFLYRTALIHVVNKWVHWIEDGMHVHQIFKVPEFNHDNFQENQFYGQVFTYLNSLASIENSDFTNLFSGKKSNDIILYLDHNQTIHDTFLGARVSWKNEVNDQKLGEDQSCCRRTLLLKIKKKDKRRILRPYLQHIHNAVSEDLQQRKREVKLYMNTQYDHRINGRWNSIPFTHPSTFDTMAMDSDLKYRIKSDLESFLKSKQYYHRLGRIWKRSYLLYGPSGTGKSSFVAAMAKLLNYDVYEIDLSRVADDSDLKMLLLQTSNKSVIVIEDLDRFMNDNKSVRGVSFSGVSTFMDGILSSCRGDEKIMIFTMNSKDKIDSSLLRPGRIDVHIYFPMCNFNSFKSLANSYLGIRDHKLFPRVEEIFQTGATMSPAEVGEIMIVNRSSPSRALKSVITALQTNAATGWRLSESASSRPSAEESGGESGGVFWKDKDSVPVAKEVRKLYGLLRLKSGKISGPSGHDSEMIER